MDWFGRASHNVKVRVLSNAKSRPDLPLDSDSCRKSFALTSGSLTNILAKSSRGSDEDKTVVGSIGM